MSPRYEIFLSVVVVLENQSDELANFLTILNELARRYASEHEIVVVDNGSTDGSIDLLRDLCGEGGMPDLQVYRLAKKVELDFAAWAGIDNSIGDYIAVVDPREDHVRALPDLLEAAMGGADVVFGVGQNAPVESLAYRAFRGIYRSAIERLTGIDARNEMPFFRVLSRSVVNYMARHQSSGLAYRWVPGVQGFKKATVAYEQTTARRRHGLLADIDRGMRLLVSSTFGPMRVVTFLSLTGALANVLYSLYVVAIYLFKDDVAPGWVTLSLQQSGMFFLISVVLLVLGEYILHTAKLAANAPNYYISEELTSATVTRRSRLNVEFSQQSGSARAEDDEEGSVSRSTGT